MVAAHTGPGGWGRADELTERIRTLHAEMLAVQAELLACVAEYDGERLWEADGAHSMGEWIAWDLDVGVQTGNDWARTATRLTHLPAIADGMNRGELSYEQTRVLCRIAEPETDATWAERGRRLSVAELNRVARRVRPVTAAESEEAHADQWLRYRWSSDRNRLEGSFVLTEDGAATVVKGLEREVDDQLGAVRGDPEIERVPYQRRLADAFVDLARRRVASDSDPDRATVVVQVPIAALADSDGGSGPGAGGWILGGPAISAETAQRLACDSRYQTVLQDAHGVGRSHAPLQRSVPPAMSRIIRIRDVTCRWPGCERTSRLHVHHVVHWANGGPTTTANCTTLCPRHHRMVHEAGYRIEGNADTELTFRRPDGTIVDIRPPPPP
ncbi:MAG: DUF222 domain-containing protein [Acidimicrobiia bacterium]|nr:DUF222 domain-containing protein [Acidimicrobiia bacterium]